MKTFILLPFVTFISFQTKTQNLVPNPSFETSRDMPSKRNNSISMTKSWTATNGAGDYYRRGAGRHAGVPKNIFGRQKPHSGNAYGGICVRKKFIEYLETKLTDTLVAGQDYLVELYISRAERSLGSVKEFGVLFASGMRFNPHDLGIKEVPSVEFEKGGRYRKKKGWMKLSATYNANGNERALIIGYFPHENSPRFRGIAHYYIDDVSVTPIQQKEETVVPEKAEDPIEIIQTREEHSLTPFTPKIGETLTLKNIFFETAKSELLPSSFPELDKLAQFLLNDLSTTIEISGHTDNKGSESKNKLLSEARAKAVSDYLAASGVEKERISYNGYGSDKPIATNDVEDGRQRNRRVEFVLNKK